VVTIWPQLVGYIKSKSIFSVSQIETYGLDIHYRSHTWGGDQKLVNCYAYVFKLKYKGVILYLHMAYPTDDDVYALMCIYMTSEMSWISELEKMMHGLMPRMRKTLIILTFMTLIISI
jgi:hypothetical protein